MLMEWQRQSTPRRLARLGFWLGVLLIAALSLVGCLQPPQQTTPVPQGLPSATTDSVLPSAFSGELNSVDSAASDFGSLEDLSSELQQTQDVDASDLNRLG